MLNVIVLSVVAPNNIFKEKTHNFLYGEKTLFTGADILYKQLFSLILM
jgi:hypothetical protein